MKIRHARQAACGGLFCVVASIGIAASDTSTALDMDREPWESCTYCHGAEGAIDDPVVPALAGQSTGYLRKQIADFRSGQRIDPNGMMSSALVLLDPSDDVTVAEHFSKRPRRARLPRSTNAATSIGEQWFLGGNGTTPPCATCHDTGENGAPALDGMNADYLARQLRRFRSGQRDNDAGAVMRSIAGQMDDSSIAAVTRFIAHR